ncbi:glycosyltransferase family 2 protein [Lyngbya aestuarii]|uniref:glycosyltransferase family 2 protein n=1 Tax=Lyngbya aestuarii TaxID=118322 RepID=UPI00058CF40E|nr:glycosyltransferase family A protein [Lyngbya aestuarii]
MNRSQISPNQPLVSVIIPAYNAEPFIAKTLTSVLAQTYKNIEVLVVDDGSQDQTAKIVQLFAEKDKRVTLFQQPNSGVAAARNLAIEKSKGEFIAPLDADDIWSAQNIEKQLQCIQIEASIGLVYAWSVEIDENDTFIGGFHGFEYEGDIYKELLYRNFIGNASAVLIRRSCLEKVGTYDPQLRVQNAQGCEDWDLYLRIAECYQVRVVKDFLIGYRQVTNSMSRNYNAMAKSHQLVLETIQRKYPEIPDTMYQWSQGNFYVYLAHQSSRNQNPKGAFFWLYQSLNFDSKMILLRYDLYTLTLKNFVKIIIYQILGLNHTRFDDDHKKSNTTQKLKFKHITKDSLNYRMKIRQLLPSNIYERIRFKGLTFNLNSTRFI